MKTIKDIYFRVLLHWLYAEYCSIDMLMTEIALEYIEKGGEYH